MLKFSMLRSSYDSCLILDVVASVIRVVVEEPLRSTVRTFPSLSTERIAVSIFRAAFFAKIVELHGGVVFRKLGL